MTANNAMIVVILIASSINLVLTPLPVNAGNEAEIPHTAIMNLEALGCFNSKTQRLPVDKNCIRVYNV